MSKLAEVLETIRLEEEEVRTMFARADAGANPLSESGERRVGRRSGARRNPLYMRQLNEAVKFLNEVREGRRPLHHLQEAMTTDDFPNLFGDIIDRQMLGSYAETAVTWPAYAKRGTVRDFRTVKRFSVDGGEAVLERVDEQEEYPEAALTDKAFSYAVQKFGRRMAFSFESLVNDDLDNLTGIPIRFGRAGRRSEEKFATGLFVDVNGPHAAFYTVGNANIVTGNPVLGVAGLRTAFEKLAAQKDEDGEPVDIQGVHLVVPPALEVTALNILNALTIEMLDQGGAANQKLIAANWIKNRVALSVNRYIPIVASGANGSTSWFLFGDPNSGRPALEVGFLRGHLEPETFVKEPNARRLGGGTIRPEDGDFDTDSVEYKVRHIFGGGRIDPKVTVASNGSGV